MRRRSPWVSRSSITNRGATTQIRTFNYIIGTALTGFLQSATNPENGTVSYTYNSKNIFLFAILLVYTHVLHNPRQE
jgi:hypothetical protein